MSRLSDLLKELCPNGVDYLELSQIATEMFRGAGIKRDDLSSDGIPCIRYGEIYTSYGVFFDRCISRVNPDKVPNKKTLHKNDLLFAITGESVSDIGKCTAYVGEEEGLVGGDILVVRHFQDAKYLSYALSTTDAVRQKGRGKVKSKVVHASADAIGRIRIPVPPLEVQREIVRILDTFTELTTEHIATLADELVTRRKRYLYYREKLFDEVKESYPRITIAELGKWLGGKTPSMDRKDYWEGGTVPWISSKDMKNGTLLDTEDHITRAAIDGASMRVFPKNCTAVVTRSGILKHTFPVAYVPFETTVNQDIKILVPCDRVLPRFAYHILNAYSERIRVATKKRGGTVDSLDFPTVLEYEIPLPDKTVQERIVSILDNYETTFGELSADLSYEIEIRKKRYEYYRDRLLTFREAK